MNDPINANPTIIDVTNLPTRLDNNSTNNNNSNNNNGNNNIQETYKFNGNNKGIVSQLVSLSLLNPLDESPESIDDTSSSSSSLEEEEEEEDNDFDPIDEQEIFDLIATISDPEHPLTLAQLAVVNLSDIKVINNHHGDGGDGDGDGGISEVLIKITPTITHCSLATLIGLGIRVRLDRSLPSRYRIKILIKEGTHQSENQVNKQLNDKERVAAACENDQLLNVISQMLSTCK
ncbi:conserved hypothetical protein [Candida dubliniensis CD36]|uniref:MIP18 family-like domain-containing protein n=1 Tax=Candida dubliniensis (strain CD36 / ATCC MYA-646 / CBS 7987 / NCPF 3949 / NRRL Y-17841) TaxID=573826 RepID=B9WKD2_CANDC|nr:conserved hypothetical protein [Candida dubliniensis CD36]CAX40782.1 conserved hypothetical protein [Candida dubliniensis CD36]